MRSTRPHRRPSPSPLRLPSQSRSPPPQRRPPKSCSRQVGRIDQDYDDREKEEKAIVCIEIVLAALEPIQMFPSQNATGTRRASFGGHNGWPRRWDYRMSSATSSTRRMEDGRMERIQIAVDGVWIRMRKKEDGKRLSGAIKLQKQLILSTAGSNSS